MKFTQLNTGARVVLSFAIVLLLMATMSAVALWRLQTADDSTSRLVNEVIAKQYLTAEVLGLAKLNGMRAISNARSDSLEASDYFLAQLAAGEKAQSALEQALARLPHSQLERSRMAELAERKKAYLALQSEVFRLKELGKTQEVGDLVDTKL